MQVDWRAAAKLVDLRLLKVDALEAKPGEAAAVPRQPDLRHAHREHRLLVGRQRERATVPRVVLSSELEVHLEAALGDGEPGVHRGELVLAVLRAIVGRDAVVQY